MLEPKSSALKLSPRRNPLTRLGVLSDGSSLYDPLGFVAPFTLSAKMILQELCKKAGMRGSTAKN